MYQDLLHKKMMREEEHVSKLRQEHLLPENVERMASATKLTNDETYVADAALNMWHERVPLLLKKKFWDVKANKIDEKLSLAAKVFVH